MTVTTMEILGRDGATSPSLGLSRATRDALAEYTRLRWPTGRRKAIEREWDLSPDQARGVMEATASAATVDAIWKHSNGGWAVLLPVLGAVVGKPLHEHLRAEIAVVARQQQELEAHAELAEVAHRRLSFPRSFRAGEDGKGPPDHRHGRGSAGDLGAEEDRRLA